MTKEMRDKVDLYEALKKQRENKKKTTVSLKTRITNMFKKIS
ncbi:MAG: hypothetical protein ACRC5M_06445 [Anaeroplasmataceae bacterium]